MGIALMGSGIALLLRSDELEEEVTLLRDLPLVPMSWVITFLGVSLIVTCIFGIWGAYKDNRFLLTVFLFFLFSIHQFLNSVIES
mmetsp:Transcript_26419/g.46838  ORF Transcript_26419/g.46838 Transcript_26419/m.46838 type:complete len:85 (+) Transcript_26419:55-309(+)